MRGSDFGVQGGDIRDRHPVQAATSVDTSKSQDGDALASVTVAAWREATTLRIADVELLWFGGSGGLGGTGESATEIIEHIGPHATADSSIRYEPEALTVPVEQAAAHTSPVVSGAGWDEQCSPCEADLEANEEAFGPRSRAGSVLGDTQPGASEVFGRGPLRAW